MFFFIDESGNTGNNLFDAGQRVLSYGALSSKKNPDALCVKLHNQILRELGEDSIHANQLGVGRLTAIAPLLYQLQIRMKFNFDYYFIDKPDFALVMFFDSVFDAGLNPAVKWDTYWTPLRYIFIRKLAELFDIELLKKSWSLCIDKKIDRRAADIKDLLLELLDRLKASPLDPRSIELMDSAFRFGIENPLELDFGHPDNKIISPNAVCFQFVALAIARRIRKAKRKDALGIIVDQQSEFNNAQIKTIHHSRLMSESIKKADQEHKDYLRFHPLHSQLDQNDVLGVGIPKKEIDIRDSKSSIGLQIIDVYLWIANRMLNQKELSEELIALSSTFLTKATIDGISMEGMINRWCNFERLLPSFDELTDETKAMHEENVNKHKEVINTLNKNGKLYSSSFTSWASINRKSQGR